MTRYTGPIKLVILDIAGTVCDGPQGLSHLFPNDDGLAVKGPVIVFEKMFQKFGMNVDWETIRRPMGKFKREHLADIMAFEDVAGQYRKAHGRRRVDIGLVHAVIDQKRRRPAADVFGIRNDVKPDAVLFFQGAIDGVTGFFWISRITANQDTIGL